MKLKNRLLKKEKRVIRYELSHTGKILIFTLGSVGLVALWRGLWSYMDSLKMFSDPVFSILFGMAVLFITGRLATN